MKKSLFLFMAISLMLLSFEGKTQLPDGSYAPNIIMTDISGTTQNLYTYLDAGKPVIMDVSAVWCGPCWSYHSTHALETYYNAYGPSGNNTSQVLWIEGDQNPLSCLQGSGCNTQGNWTSGSSFPMMLTAAPNNAQVNSDYAIGYFPTVYKICPDRSVYEVGAVSSSALHTAALACPAVTTKTNDVKAHSVETVTPLGLCGSITPKVVIQNYGTATLTSCTITTKIDGVLQNTYNWTGSLATYEIATANIPVISGITPGIHNITFETSLPNGVADENTTNDAFSKSFTGNLNVFQIPFAQGFESSTFPPADWLTFDLDNDHLTWIRKTGTTSGGFGQSTSCAKLDFYNSPPGNIDELLVSPIDLSLASAAKLTFSVAYARYDNTTNDKLQIQASINCGTSWVTIYDKSGTTLATAPDKSSGVFTPTAAQWRSDTVNLANYVGKSKVFFKFKGISAYGNDLYVDDINIAQITGINSVSGSDNNVAVYPNPFSNFTNVTFTLAKAAPVSIDIYNLLGEKVLSLDKTEYGAGANSVTINSEKLCQGVYYLKAAIGDHKYTQKLTIVK